MVKIIGGPFGIESQIVEDEDNAWFVENSIGFINGRSALTFACVVLDPDKIWLPSYCPDFLISCFPKNKLKFYEIGKDFRVKDYKWMAGLTQNDVVVTIDYFGFPFDEECAKIIREMEVCIIEDACQALMSSFIGKNSDIIVLSPRKFFGIPDGGLLVCGQYGRFLDIEPKLNEWVRCQTDLQVLRKDFDDKNICLDYNDIKRISELNEDNVPLDFCRMSDVSKLILYAGVDYRNAINQRRVNFKLLLEELWDIALFKDQPETVTPYGFPVLVENRDRVKRFLLRNNIDTEIHWKMNKVPKKYKENHDVSKRILTLPCDQRYTEIDMYQISETLKLILRELK